MKYDVSFLRPFNTKYPKIRLGINSDGGYVILDHIKYDCYISCGISQNTSFDEDFINRFINNNNKRIYLFDGTITEQKLNPILRQFFHKQNIGNNSINSTNLTDILSSNNDIFLKMDIEGHEYRWVADIDNALFKNIKQMVVEFHNLQVVENIDYIKQFLNYHKIVHIHGNNCCPMVHHKYASIIPSTLEITMLRNDELFEKNSKFYSPTDIDVKNVLNKPEAVFEI